MFSKSTLRIKKIVAVILIICLLPFSDFSNIAYMWAEDNQKTTTQENIITNTQAASDNAVTTEAVEVERKCYEITGEALTADIIIDGDANFSSGTLDLNGHTMTIKGDLFHADGTIEINNGKLIIEGDYCLQERYFYEDGEKVYWPSYGKIIMNHADDYVLVYGDFICQVYKDFEGFLTDGILEIKGDFLNPDDYYINYFRSEENHKVVLSGASKQEISTEPDVWFNIEIANLEVTNSSEEGIIIGENIYVKKQIITHGNSVSGEVMIGAETSFDTDYFNGNIKLLEDWTVEGNMTINGSLMSSDTVYAGVTVRGTLNVNGDILKQAVNLEHGTVNVYGNMSARISMINESDYIRVAGDFSGSGDVNAGILEVAGDFSTGGYFRATGTNKVILNGITKQIVSTEATDCFATLELQNYSEEGVFSEQIIAVTNLIKNGCKLSYANIEGVDGWTLNQDEKYEGNLTLLNGTLDLNGHTLTVAGDLVHAGGTINVNNGTLIVEGDYCQQSRSGEEGAYTYFRSAGILLMQNERDHVIVNGSFITETCVNQEGYLTNGVLEIKGNFTQSNIYSQYCFVATENHTVLLSGNAKQTVSFDSNANAMNNYIENYIDYSRIANLEITNDSEEGIEIPRHVYVSGQIKSNGAKVDGSIVIGASTSFYNNEYTGNVYLAKERTFTDNITINGDFYQEKNVIITGQLKINGNYTVTPKYGYIRMRGGRLIISGDFTAMKASGWDILCMETDEDYIYVGGDLRWQSGCPISLWNGTLEIEGDFIVDAYFFGHENNRVILSGTQKQVVDIEDEYGHFAILELQNYSEEGVYSEKALTVATLVHNGCNIEYGDTDGLYGWTLIQDDVISGDLNLFGDTLDLNGHTLIIKGDLIHGEETIDVNGGTLIVEGDYHIQKRTEEDGTYTYSEGSGSLYMNDANAHIVVNGDFVAQSKYSHWLTDGVLEIKGNVTLLDSANKNYFYLTGNHTILLSGTGAQNIFFETSSAYTSRIANLEITNTSEEGVFFASEVLVEGQIKSNGNKVGGTIAVGPITTFDNNEYTGDVHFTSYKDLNTELTINGNVTVESYLGVNSEFNVNGNYSNINGGNLYVKNGRVNISGDYSSGNYGMVLFEDESYVYVDGNYNDTSYFSTLINGTLEVAGNFTASGKFQSLNTSKVILSGTEKQTVTLSEDSCFATLELRNYSEEGVYSKNPLTRRTLIRNGCTITYGNIEGTYGWTLQEDEIWEGDLLLKEDTLDLNGHTLTIRGDLIHQAGNIHLSGGTLIVEGNYRLQVNTEDEDADSSSKGILIMNKPEDMLFVAEDFIIDSLVSHNGCLTDGVMEIRGDITQLHAKEFIASDNHTVILGISRTNTDRNYIQTISFQDTTAAKLNKLVLKKELAEYNFTNNPGDICNQLVSAAEGNMEPTSIDTVSGESIDCTSITISYTEAYDDTGVAGYKIYRDGEQVGITSALEFTDTGLEPSTVYTYTVYAFDEYGKESATSPELQVTTKADTKAPSTPTLSVRTRTGSSITLTWNAVSDNVKTCGYRIYRDGELLADNLTETSYKDKGLEENVVYEYKIEAYDKAGNVSDKSKSVSAVVAPPSITYISPKDYSSIGGNTVKLYVRFKNPGNSTGNRVKIEYKTTGDDWKLLAPTLLGQKVYNSTAFYVDYNWDISKLSGNQEYTIRYTLYDADGNTDVQEATYQIDKEAPAVVENVQAVADNGTVKLKWDASTSADCATYRIYRAEVETPSSGQAVVSDAVNYEILAAVGGRYVTNYTDNDVIEGKTYAYKMTATDHFGNTSTESTVAAVTVDIDMEAPEVESVLPKAGRINGVTKLTVTAKDNIQVKEILLQYRTEEMQQWTDLATLQANNGMASYYWDTTELEDGIYYINAVAVDKNGNRSLEEYTRRYEVDNTGISQIQITECDAGSTYAQLHWADVMENDFAYFQVEQKTGDTFAVVGTVSDTLGYNVTGLAPGETYVFRVVGYDNLGNRGIPSEEYTVTTVADETAPKITAVYPVQSRYKDVLNLQMQAEDNYAVDYGVFSYSYDKENFVEIARVDASTHSKSVSLNYTFDISSIPEGDIYIKFEAYDTAGNKNALLQSGEEVTARYIVDRSAPEKPSNLMNSDVNGCIELTWNTSAQEDVQYYRIYRADNTTGIYFMINGKCQTANYYDKNVLSGRTYLYKIDAVDIAGNVSEMSEEIVVTVQEDRTAPVIKGMYPSKGTVVGANPTITILAMDNSYIDKVYLAYQKKDAEDGIWHEIPVGTISQTEGINALWNTDGLEDGEYNLRAYVTDTSGNESALYSVSCTLDGTAPAKPVLTAETGNYQIELNIEEDEEVAAYEIYRKELGGNYERIGTIKKRNSYTDTSITPNQIYYYMVKAYDAAGNSCESTVAGAYATDEDTVAPTAVLPEYMSSMTDMELQFDATASTDNVRVTEYCWNLCNGETITGARPVYTYKEAGVYTVILTVKDEAGNTDSTTTTVEVLEQTEQGMAKVQVVDTQGVPIPYAAVYMQISEEEKLSLKADSNGYVTLASKVGDYKVAAFKNGYLPKDMDISISQYETREYQLVLESGELVVGDLTVRKMDLQEMVDAGVDFSDTLNYNIFTYNITLTFEQNPIPVTIEYIGTGETEEYTFDTDSMDTDEDDSSSGETGGGFTVAVQEIRPKIESANGEEEEIPILAYVSTSEQIQWLQEMFSVELGVLNAADREYVIEDASATLELPSEGVRLASTHDGQQLTQSMGDIRGQERKSVSWVVRGEKSGSYTLGADFNGTLMPFGSKVTAHFETQEEFQVSAGEGIHIYVMPEKTAYIGENYFIQFMIQNESDRNFYNFSAVMGPYAEETPVYEVKVTTVTGATVVLGESERKIYYMPELGQCSQMPVLHDGEQLNIPVLRPGDRLYGTYYKKFEGEGATEDDYSKLTEYMAETITGENTGVQVHIVPIDSHITKKAIEYKLPVSDCGDPIQLTTGAYEDEVDVFSITGGMKAAFVMDYNSLNSGIKGELGYGWTHNYESRLEEHNGILDLYMASGECRRFIHEDSLNNIVKGTVADGEIILDAAYDNTGAKYVGISYGMEDYSIVKNEAGEYVLTTPDDNQYLYACNGQLIKMITKSGQSISFTRSGEQLILTEDVSGRRMLINYNADGRIVSLEDDYGRKVTFTYENDCLTTITNPLGYVTTYRYDENHRIVSVTNDLGVTYVTNEYDERGRVIRQYNAQEDEFLDITYEETKEGTLVTVTDEEGHDASITVDAMGRMVTNVNQNGSTTTYGYDKDSNLLSVTNARGDKASYTYNDSGDRLSMTDAEGSQVFYGYDDKGNLTSVTDGAGRSATYRYNEAGLMTEVVDFAGKKTTYEYNESGQLIKETVEGLGSREYTYTNGLLTCTTAYNGNKAYMDYDNYGNVTKLTDAQGNVTAYQYDACGNLLKETDATGAVTIYAYDCNGSLISETDSRGNTTSYTYDGNGRTIKETYADGTSTSYEYNLKREKTAEIYADGTRSEYAYDPAGNLVKETLPDGSVITYEYDALDMCIRQTNESGDSAAYEYNSIGKVTKETYPDGTYLAYEYDACNRLSSVIDKEGNTTSYTYDSMSNIIGVTDALGNQETSTYDIYGRMTSKTDANGNTYSYTYDANGNCTSVTNPLGEVTYCQYDELNRLVKNYLYKDGREISQSFTYDALGRVSTATDEIGNTTAVSYDSNGNLYQLTDAKGNIVNTYNYDCMDRLSTETDALGYETVYIYDSVGSLIEQVQYLNTEAQRTYSYNYDLLGRMTSCTDPLDGISSCTYDEDGNIATITDPNEGVTTYTYDSMGRVLSCVNAIGSKTTYEYNTVGLLEKATNARNQNTAYEYDALGRITSMTDELGTITYTYDANGNVLTVSDEHGTIERTYDELNRIKTYTDYKGNTISYGYDQLGNRISLTYPGGEIIRYTYYDNGYLHTVTDGSGNVTTYEYDANGNLIKTTRPDGSVESRSYNEANWLMQLSDNNAAGEVINQYTYTYDERGNITSIAEATPDAVGVDDEVDSTDNVDLSSVSSATMTYDAANRLISYNGEEVKYDADGNMTYGPVNGEMTELEYDCRNRLVKAGDTTYEYDAENVRIAVETLEYREEYITDSSEELSKVLVITKYWKSDGSEDALSVETTYCYYGNGLVYEKTDDELLIYHFNNIGSTTCLTNQLGEVVERYDYGTYGELLSGDITLTPFLYNGQYGVMNDANGLSYMRARYYNSEIKRFINQDVVNGDITNSQSLNKYCYVQGNPISLIDPFGLSPLSTALAVTHVALDIAGFVPKYGEIADGVNAVIYAAEGEWGMAFVSLGSAVIPVAGDTLFKGAKYSDDIIKGISHTNFGKKTVIPLCKKIAKKGDDILKGFKNGIKNKWDDAVSKGKKWLGIGDPKKPKKPKKSSKPKSVDVESGAVANTLTDAQKSRLNALDNTISDHLTDGDFSGTLRDLQGNPVPNGKGGYFDHLGEMQDSYRSLQKIKKALEGSLKNPNLSNVDRAALQEGLDKANSYIIRIEELFEPYGGIK